MLSTLLALLASATQPPATPPAADEALQLLSSAHDRAMQIVAEQTEWEERLTAARTAFTQAVAAKRPTPEINATTAILEGRAFLHRMGRYRGPQDICPTFKAFFVEIAEANTRRDTYLDLARSLGLVAQLYADTLAHVKTAAATGKPVAPEAIEQSWTQRLRASTVLDLTTVDRMVLNPPEPDIAFDC